METASDIGHRIEAAGFPQGEMKGLKRSKQSATSRPAADKWEQVRSLATTDWISSEFDTFFRGDSRTHFCGNKNGIT